MSSWIYPCVVCKLLQRNCTEGCVFAPYFLADQPQRFANVHRMFGGPCAACKFLERKCTEGCVFAPYFPADQPLRFGNVQLVFGASNVEKMLNGVSPEKRKDVANSLAYEAAMRVSDPVHGCVGHIFVLQQRLWQIQHDLEVTRRELAAYVGPAASGVSLGHNVFAPPPPFYYHPHQQSSGVQMGMGLSAAPTQMLNPLQQHLLLWESALVSIQQSLQQSCSSPPLHWQKGERDI